MSAESRTADAVAEPTDAATADPAMPGVPHAAMEDLAVNVPDLPQIVDRMGTAVLVLAICLLAALFYRKRRALAGTAKLAPPRMRVVSRIPVSRRGEVCLVEIDQRLMVVGLDAQGIRSLVPLDPAPAAQAAAQPDFAAVQEQVLRRRDERRSASSSPPPPRPRREVHPELLPG